MSKKAQITVLGAGLVGSAIVKDFAKSGLYQVLSTDLSQDRLSDLGQIPGVSTKQGDASNPAFLAEVCSDADLVVCAVPGFMGFNTLKQVIELGKNIVDISFFPENAFELNELALKKGVTAVVDCGVAPGLCNIQAGWVQRKMDSVDSYVCYVGGLPRTRTWPFEYKAVFSPIDVIEEYTRPARFVEYNQLVTRPALTDLEKMDFPGVGTLEAFNTDGLRSLIHTLDAPFKKEKTLRYPGHVELMRAFREAGFFDSKPIGVGTQEIAPIDLTSKLLFDQWKLQPGEQDLTVMHVALTGKENGEAIRYSFDLLDYFDVESGVHSMARTTGYTCTIVAGQVLSGLFDRKGISPPEYIGQSAGCYENLLDEYSKRGIMIKSTRTKEK